MLLVAIVTGARADQTWDFTTMSTTDKAAYDADGTNWSWDKSSGYYGNKFTANNGVWTSVISTTISQISGMKFIRYNSNLTGGALRVVPNSTGESDGYLKYNNNNVAIGIQANQGDEIKITFGNTASSAKGYVLTNAKRVSDNATTITTAQNTPTTETLVVLANGLVEFKCNDAKVVLYKIVLTSASGKTASECAFATTAPSINFPGTATYTQVATTAANYDGTVNYTLSNNTCGASINETTHEVTVTQEGHVTVTATATATDNYSASSASYTLTVTDTRTALTASWDNAAPVFPIGEDATNPVFTVTGGEAVLGTDYTVEYTKVSGDDLATIGATTGITAINTSAAGTETIKATVTVTSADYILAKTEYNCVITVAKIQPKVTIYSLTDNIGSASVQAADATVNAGVSLVLSNTNGRIKITAVDGQKFKAGDIITFTGTVGNQDKYFGIKYGATTSLGTNLKKSSKGDGTVEGTLTLDEDADVIYIGRYDGTTTTLTNFVISREATTSFELNAKGYATYSQATDFEFAGATAYKMALDETAKTITGTAVAGKIAAGEGILFKGEAGATVAIFNTTGATALEDNDLKGTTSASGKATVPTFCYTLSGNTFKRFKGAAFNDNKAYFEASQDLKGQSFEIIFDDQPTAISFVVEDDANVVAAPVKTIKNGQLFIGNYNVAGARIK